MDMHFTWMRNGDNQNTFKFIGHPARKIWVTITQKTTRRRITRTYAIFTYIKKQGKSNIGDSREGLLIHKGPIPHMRLNCFLKH